MTGVWALAALWLALALIASLLSIWLRISTALSEIVVGTIAQLIIGAAIGSAVLGTDESWVKFLSGLGAIVLTFLAGAELDLSGLNAVTLEPEQRLRVLARVRVPADGRRGQQHYHFVITPVAGLTAAPVERTAVFYLPE